jgi:hypothetical protein
MLFWTASDNTASITNNPISNKKNHSNAKTSSSADERCILTERLQWCGEGYGQGHIPSGYNIIIIILSILSSSSLQSLPSISLSISSS